LIGLKGGKIALFEPSTNQFGYVARGYPITHVTLKIGCKGLQWVCLFGTDQNGNVRVHTNPKFFHPAEVDLLIGDPTLAEKELVQMIIDSDVSIVEEAVKGGYAPPVPSK